MESPDGTPEPEALARPGGGGVVVETIAVAAFYSLMLAAYGAFVFCESAWPTPIQRHGYFFAALLAAVLWALNFTRLAVPGALLILGLVHLHQRGRLAWRLAAAWTGAVAASIAIGRQNISCFDNWSGYGPPYWHALIAAVGQLAAGAAILALIVASARGAGLMAGRGSADSVARTSGEPAQADVPDLPGNEGPGRWPFDHSRRPCAISMRRRAA